MKIVLFVDYSFAKFFDLSSVFIKARFDKFEDEC